MTESQLCCIAGVKYRVFDTCVPSTKRWAHVLTLASPPHVVKYIYRRGPVRPTSHEPESGGEDPSVMLYFFDASLRSDIVALCALTYVCTGARVSLFVPLRLENTEHCQFLVWAARDAAKRGLELKFDGVEAYCSYDVKTESYVLCDSHYVDASTDRHYLEPILGLAAAVADSVKNWDPLAAAICTGYNASVLGALVKTQSLLEACIIWSLRYRNPLGSMVSLDRIAAMVKCMPLSSVLQDPVPPDLLPLYDSYANLKWNF